MMASNQTSATVDKVSATVAIFGAGIAGLAAAHELIELGFRVAVYEITDSPGGFAKSARIASHPAEYSWRGFGPWYHNVFEIMRRIPVDGQNTVYSKQLSPPIRFAMPRDCIGATTAEQASDDATQLRDRFQFTWRDIAHLCVAFARTAVADDRSMLYASMSATDYMKSRMSAAATRMLSATFGPWIGIDPKNTSVHHAGLFFRKNFFPGSGSAASISQGAEGWRVLRSPSNESWFEPWVRHLESRGVQFYFQDGLYRLAIVDGSVCTAQTSRNHACADYYVMAVTPFACKEILARSPDTADLAKLFSGLTKNGPHVQVSFRIGFSEKINIPGDYTAIILPDSEYNITLLPVDLIWHKDVSLGDGIKSLWTGTACVSYAGIRPVSRCSKEHFLEEIIRQVFGSQGLGAMVATANGGRSLLSLKSAIARTEVWHEWAFYDDATGTSVRSEQPKWVNFIGTQQFRPFTTTSVPNLFLAGAHVKTDADIWSMEGAVESGRRAAFAVAKAAGCALKQPIVIRKPWWMRLLSAGDNWLYRKHLPNIADVTCAACLALILALIWTLVVSASVSEISEMTSK